MSGENPQQVSSGQASARWVIGGLDRSEAWTPVKTAEGRAEISRRSRALNQRLRTVLLLIDGRRTISQIRTVALQVGAPDSCLDDLLDMGLVALPEPAAASTTTVTPAATEPAPVVARPEAPVSTPEPATPVTAEAVPEQIVVAPVEQPAVGPPPVIVAARVEPLPAALESLAVAVPSGQPPVPQALLDEAWAQPDTMPLESHHEIRYAANDDASVSQPDGAADTSPSKRLTSELFDELVRATPRRDAGPSTIDSTLRSTTGGRLDSVMSSLYPLLESAFGNAGRIPNAERPQDDTLEEARRILMREVRAKAPVTGALTLVKLRRATTREELTALFDEVGSHISLPMRRLSTQQILLHVKSLLERPM
jgi:hypothetical protein